MRIDENASQDSPSDGSDGDLSELVRHRLRKGVLPAATWRCRPASRASGRRCLVCDQSVVEPDADYVIAGVPERHVHATCYGVWIRESVLFRAAHDHQRLKQALKQPPDLTPLDLKRLELKPPDLTQSKRPNLTQPEPPHLDLNQPVSFVSQPQSIGKVMATVDGGTCVYVLWKYHHDHEGQLTKERVTDLRPAQGHGRHITF